MCVNLGCLFNVELAYLEAYRSNNTNNSNSNNNNNSSNNTINDNMNVQVDPSADESRQVHVVGVSGCMLCPNEAVSLCAFFWPAFVKSAHAGI